MYVCISVVSASSGSRLGGSRLCAWGNLCTKQARTFVAFPSVGNPDFRLNNGEVVVALCRQHSILRRDTMPHSLLGRGLHSSPGTVLPYRQGSELPAVPSVKQKPVSSSPSLQNSKFKIIMFAWRGRRDDASELRGGGGGTLNVEGGNQACFSAHTAC